MPPHTFPTLIKDGSHSRGSLLLERVRERNAEDKKVVERDSEVLLRGPTWLLPTWKAEENCTTYFVGQIPFLP
jgi:hypothetical protein